LIAPLADHLQGARRLIVVPHGKLCLLPWAGLWDSTAGAYLVDRFDQGISVLPGARVGRLLNRPRNDAAADLDLVVNPQSDLLFDEFEADWVLRRLGGQSRLLTAADADEENLRVLLPRCRWLHFCGHGEFDLARPMASHLKLSGGDRWTGWDMLSAPLPSTTVILSACEVGSAHAEAAGEWFGVLRGLLMAGASSVLACLWKISDLVCLPFIQSFYEEHGANRGDLGAALRAAQLHVRELGSWASLAQGAGCLEQVDWQHGVDPHRSPLLEIGAPSLAHRAMELLSTALNLWLKGPLGHLARDRQVLQQLDRQLRFLAQLSHPRWWSAFQLYGCHGTGNRLVSPTEEAQGP
jgi:CHAT domain-containing protein